MKNLRPPRFSLVELLIVIAILVLLAAMVLPMLARSRERTRRIECARQLRQIGLGMMMYANDFDNYLPSILPSPTRYLEPLAELNYVTEDRLWSCPSSSVQENDPELSAFAYLGSGMRDSSRNPSSDSVMHDIYDNHPGNEWNNVLYLDIHVEGGNPLRSLDFQNKYESFATP